MLVRPLPHAAAFLPQILRLWPHGVTGFGSGDEVLRALHAGVTDQVTIEKTPFLQVVQEIHAAPKVSVEALMLMLAV